jgi:large repetitive protein
MSDDISTLTFMTESLPRFTVGEDYDQILQVEGGFAPVTFAIESGEFPDGIQLSSWGVVAGTPTDDSGDTTVFITATDGTGANITQAFECEVRPAKHDQDEEPADD